MQHLYECLQDIRKEGEEKAVPASNIVIWFIIPISGEKLVIVRIQLVGIEGRSVTRYRWDLSGEYGKDILFYARSFWMELFCLEQRQLHYLTGYAGNTRGCMLKGTGIMEKADLPTAANKVRGKSYIKTRRKPVVMRCFVSAQNAQNEKKSCVKSLCTSASCWQKWQGKQLPRHFQNFKKYQARSHALEHASYAYSLALTNDEDDIFGKMVR